MVIDGTFGGVTRLRTEIARFDPGMISTTALKVRVVTGMTYLMIASHGWWIC